MLLIKVKTYYKNHDAAASVRVNGTEIGKVYARFWDDHFHIDFADMWFIFSRGVLLGAPYPWIQVPNTLEIVPHAPTATDSQTDLLVGKVVFFHNAA